MKKNILFVVDEQMYGGISVVLTTLLNRMDYEKYNIDLLILHNRGESLINGNLTEKVNILYGTSFFSAIDLTISQVLKSKNLALIFHKIQIILGLKTGWIKNKIIKERKKILKKHYDIEIAFKDGFCALFTALGNSNKKISWLHTSYDVHDYTEKYRNLFKQVYEKIDKIVAITEDVSSTFNKIYNKKEKTEIIENLIDIEGVIEKSKEENVNFSKDFINLICVGRIAYQKAYPRLILQIAKLKEEGYMDNVILHIIGDGDDSDTVNKIIEENNLKENINLIGYKQNPYPYIAKSDMLLLPSLYEGLGLVLIEANILGVPCFATKFANVDKTLSNGKYGLIVENSEDGIYSGLKNILKNNEIIRKYKENLINYKYDKNEEIITKINVLFEEKQK
ncbi:MAG: glycosyltransferase [Clostridia bacterium]|nr:glycosyltransferase [Clostridia bacterium]